MAADGTVSINDSDIQSLGLSTDDDSPYRDGSRLIDNNLALDQALMINGTIGTEGFIEPKDVRIFNNKATNQATMINASISEKTWKESREDRRETIKMMVAKGALSVGQSSELFQGQGDYKPKPMEAAREGRVERSESRHTGTFITPGQLLTK